MITGIVLCTQLRLQVKTCVLLKPALFLLVTAKGQLWCFMTVFIAPMQKIDFNVSREIYGTSLAGNYALHYLKTVHTWWRHHMETFSALLPFCVGNTSVTGGFPSQRPVMQSFDVFFDLLMKQQMSKQWRRRWLRRHCAHYDVIVMKWAISWNVLTTGSFKACVV